MIDKYSQLLTGTSQLGPYPMENLIIIRNGSQVYKYYLCDRIERDTV
jgi:hypothetical protein